MSCNNCNNDCLNNESCNCNCTTTTTCSSVAEKPCVTICSDIYASECNIYEGEDNDCFGVKKGDKVKDIINNIIIKLAGNNCSCEYGTATINLITTTTSSTSTTTTTTEPPYSLCITIYEENNCNFAPKEITAGSFINGKETYTFTYNSINYIIKWSIVDERWELFLTSNFAFPIAYLEQDVLHPIAPLKGDLSTHPELSWKMYGIDSILVTTRTCCPENLCALFTVEDGSFETTIQSQMELIYR